MKKVLKTSILLFISMFSLLFSACVTKEFTIETDIVDNLDVHLEEYSFTASAKYDSLACELVVKVNDEIIEKNEDKYIVLLKANENIFVLTAMFAEKEYSENYTINYIPHEEARFTIETDIADANIIDDVVVFTAQAKYAGKECALAVLHNEEYVEPSLGKYSISLANGENSVLFIARSGDHIESLEKIIDYKGFRFNTDLKDEDTVNEVLKFRAGATYGKDSVDLTVTVNGEAVEASGISYSVILTEGENIILFTASTKNIVKTIAYKIGYSDALPTLVTSIVDGASYKGNIFSFDVIARDGLNRKIAYEQISFAVDFKLKGVFTSVTDIKKVWDDSYKTSFRINFKEGSFASLGINNTFKLRITAVDSFGKSVLNDYTLTYVGADADGSIGEVVFSIEGFTVGIGYLIEPMKIKVYEDTPFAYTLIESLAKQGWTYRNTGTPDSSFYLSAISGLDLTGNEIAEGIWEEIERKKLSYERSISGSTLSEFSYGSGSGWMYSVNGSFPNFGFSDYYPQDGDIVRVQFTLLLGNDIGGGVSVGLSNPNDLLTDNPDYAPIMRTLASINADDSIDKTIYNEAIAVVSIWNITKEVMVEQIEKLTGWYDSK